MPRCPVCREAILEHWHLFACDRLAAARATIEQPPTSDASAQGTPDEAKIDREQIIKERLYGGFR